MSNIRHPTEHEEQSALIDWWAHYGPSQGLDHRLLVAIPNAQILMGAARNKHAVMARLRNEGFRDGFPDLFLAVKTPAFPGMMIEMKRKKEKVKPGSAQEYMIYLLRSMGWNVVVCQGADEAMKAIKMYLRPLVSPPVRDEPMQLSGLARVSSQALVYPLRPFPLPTKTRARSRA